jgi:hypothetical protein
MVPPPANKKAGFPAYFFSVRANSRIARTMISDLDNPKNPVRWRSRGTITSSSSRNNSSGMRMFIVFIKILLPRRNGAVSVLDPVKKMAGGCRPVLKMSRHAVLEPSFVKTLSSHGERDRGNHHHPKTNPTANYPERPPRGHRFFY